MRRLSRLLLVLAHPRELRLAVSGLAARMEGDSGFGGLDERETDALAAWVRDSGAPAFVEIGTLFGFTARRIAATTRAKVIAVDDFSWNPFGLSPEHHEAFARKVLSGSGVELVKARSPEVFRALPPDVLRGAFVFLDGDHSYRAVREELAALRAAGLRAVAGHDFGRPPFGVERAVREAFGAPDEVSGTCWIKRFGP